MSLWDKLGNFGNELAKGFTWTFDKIGRGIGNFINKATGATAKMEWEKQMSDTAHQREVADLQAAGLNPVLSAGGSGASTPSAPSGTGDPIGAIFELVGTAAKVMNSSASLINATTNRQLAVSGYKSFRKYGPRS